MPGPPSSVWTTYRTTILLSAFVILGWIWDLTLGGGWVHAIGWLTALVLVGGISALAAHNAARNAATSPPAAAAANPADTHRASTQQQSSTGPLPIRTAVPADFEHLIEIEQAADKLFEVAGYGSTPGPATPEELAAAELVLVAGIPPVGYARVEVLDGRAHLEGLSVRPRSMRKGVGSALVEAACDWAFAAGYTELSLTTFAEVPWNGPFYAGRGFVELRQPSPGLLALREAERQIGLDGLGRRIVMVRKLGPEAALPTE